MLQYKNGLLCSNGVGLPLPEDFFLDTDTDAIEDAGVVIWTPDQKYKIDWGIHEDIEDTKEELERLFSSNTGLRPLSDIIPVVLGGLQGYQVAYEGGRSRQWYEVRFSLPRGGSIIIIIGSDAGALETPNDPYVQKFLNEIQKLED